MSERVFGFGGSAANFCDVENYLGKVQGGQNRLDQITASCLMICLFETGEILNS
jgi:hypothetical protein